MASSQHFHQCCIALNLHDHISDVTVAKLAVRDAYIQFMYIFLDISTRPKFGDLASSLKLP